MTFAVGKKSQAICDRCGYQYDYLDLQKEWNGLLVCPECYEPKHPQLDPSYHAADAQALPFTRPAREEPMIVFVGGSGDSSFTSNGMQPSEESRALIMGSSVGKVTVEIS